MTDLQQLEASARRALDALAMLILDNPDPGTEALGAQYELRQALFGQPSEFPAIRVWQIQAQRRDGSWNNYSAPIVDEAEAHGDYAETVANSGQHWAFRLVSSVTTQTVEAQHPKAETRTNWIPGPVAVARAAAAVQQPETQADPGKPCTCAAAGDCFAPAGHYADCPQADKPAAVSQPDQEA